LVEIPGWSFIYADEIKKFGDEFSGKFSGE